MRSFSSLAREGTRDEARAGRRAERPDASRRDLPAALVQRAAAPGRAPGAVAAGAHLEGGRAHAVADLRHQLPGPGLPHRDVAGQRVLRLLLGLRTGADLQQRRPARGVAVRAERAGGDGHLVGGELPVGVDVARGGAAGLEVDDDQPAGAVALETVDLAADAG